MTDAEITKTLKGAKEIEEWFGFWPSFHDAEVTRLSLDRDADSSFTLFTWRNTPEVTEAGFYKQEKHLLVTFHLQDVFACEFSGFNHQNVLSGLAIEQNPDGFIFTLGDCHGLAGTISAKSAHISYEPTTEINPRVI